MLESVKNNWSTRELERQINSLLFERLVLSKDRERVLEFYNYVLKCFMFIDLKVGKLTHQDIGQMNFYVRYFENEWRLVGDNPSIGLILCSDEKETLEKIYSLGDEENSFWAWEKLTKKTKGTSAFKARYLRCRCNAIFVRYFYKVKHTHNLTTHGNKNNRFDRICRCMEGF